jgi:hypothetical protein
MATLSALDQLTVTGSPETSRSPPLGNRTVTAGAA